MCLLDWPFGLSSQQEVNWQGEVLITSNSNCLVCQEHEETLVHGLFQCIVAREIWYDMAALNPIDIPTFWLSVLDTKGAYSVTDLYCFVIVYMEINKS